MSKSLLLAVLLLLGSVCAHAVDAPAPVTEALQKVLPNTKIDSVAPSSMPGFYVAIVAGHVLHVSADGKYLIEGLILDVPNRADIKDADLAVMRKEALAKIPKERLLVFAPPHPKHKVVVFTDVDCPYCRQFHKQIADYNRLGIEVDYVLFPLNIHPGADKKAEAVWCASDRNSAYTSAMNGQTVPQKTCDNPIKELVSGALAMGLSGTPAILTEDGSQVGGYVAPADLAQRLDGANKAPN